MLKRIEYTCNRCDKPWSGFSGSLCPVCGGSPVSEFKTVPIHSGEPRDNWKSRSTPEFDEN